MTKIPNSFEHDETFGADENTPLKRPLGKRFGAVVLVGSLGLGGTAAMLDSNYNASQAAIITGCKGDTDYRVEPGESFKEILSEIGDSIATSTKITPSEAQISYAVSFRNPNIKWVYSQDGLGATVPEGVNTIVGPATCPDPKQRS